MAKGPRGERRPADVIGAAIMAAKIATGETETVPTQARTRQYIISGLGFEDLSAIVVGATCNGASPCRYPGG